VGCLGGLNVLKRFFNGIAKYTIYSYLNTSELYILSGLKI
jgi:hypothetical protein